MWPPSDVRDVRTTHIHTIHSIRNNSWYVLITRFRCWHDISVWSSISNDIHSTRASSMPWRGMSRWWMTLHLLSERCVRVCMCGVWWICILLIEFGKLDEIAENPYSFNWLGGACWAKRNAVVQMKVKAVPINRISLQRHYLKGLEIV